MKNFKWRKYEQCRQMERKKIGRKAKHFNTRNENKFS